MVYCIGPFMTFDDLTVRIWGSQVGADIRLRLNS